MGMIAPLEITMKEQHFTASLKSLKALEFCLRAIQQDKPSDSVWFQNDSFQQPDV